MAPTDSNIAPTNVVEYLQCLSLADTKLLQSLLTGIQGYPLSIFSSSLGPLEAATKYLIEEKKISMKQVAILLGRNYASLYKTYRDAKKKMPEPLVCDPDAIVIPYHVLGARHASLLEILVAWIHEHAHVSLKKVSLLLNRSYSTIKTAHWRYSLKK